MVGILFCKTKVLFSKAFRKKKRKKNPWQSQQKTLIFSPINLGKPSAGWRAIWVHPPASAAAGAFDVATAAAKAAAGPKVVPEAEVAKVAEAAGRVGRDGVFGEESQSPSQGYL